MSSFDIFFGNFSSCSFVTTDSPQTVLEENKLKAMHETDLKQILHLHNQDDQQNESIWCFVFFVRLFFSGANVFHDSILEP